MTDLPQLQTSLVGAAVRRRRRRHARTALVAAVLLATVPLLAREVAVPDPEVPVAPPAPTATPQPTVEGSFSVFARPPGEFDTLGPDARFIGGSKRRPIFLVKRDDQLCLTVRPFTVPTELCGPARNFLSGEHLLTGLFGGRYVVAVPDGVKDLTLTRPGERGVRVEGGALAYPLGAGSARLEWTAPEGWLGSDQVNGRDAAADWARFWDEETPLDRLDGLPGARRLIAKEDVTAWLVPRRDAICLVVAVRNARRSACRRKLGDTRFPIVVSVEDRIVAAFPDTLKPDGVRPARVRTTGQADAFVIFDGDRATTLRYRDRAGHRELRLPEQTSFVLNAEPMDPRALKPPE